MYHYYNYNYILQKDFVSTLDKIIKDTLTEDFWNITVPNDLAAASVRSPTLFANFALVEWKDNIDISGMPPPEYMKKFSSRLSKEMMYWHALPEGWENMKYDEFLAKRRKLIAKVIRNGYSKLLNRWFGYLLFD